LPGDLARHPVPFILPDFGGIDQGEGAIDHEYQVEVQLILGRPDERLDLFNAEDLDFGRTSEEPMASIM
jgi:hypothetical protein